MPLIFPLGEAEEKQGFTWEREWRSRDPEGFKFDYSDIKIICCPEDEQAAIATILGEFANDITFVQSWAQYNDIKNFLSSRKDAWKGGISIKGEAIDKLNTLKTDLKRELNKAEAYQNYIDKVNSELNDIEKFKKFY
ncbi:hypothetical protein [Legionella tunisiensis]|uniref:hypothetical protein n=1 Tax=Legionella tunisiensis TaxID=1034944 RepID=UPI0002E6FC0D|nr:hypothetical protein [Legionella tunisiensis]